MMTPQTASDCPSGNIGSHRNINDSHSQNVLLVPSSFFFAGNQTERNDHQSYETRLTLFIVSYLCFICIRLLKQC